MIGKGTVSSITAGKALVVPYDAQTAVTHPMSIPDELKDRISPGNQVAYVTFEDNTGTVIGLADD